MNRLAAMVAAILFGLGFGCLALMGCSGAKQEHQQKPVAGPSPQSRQEKTTETLRQGQADTNAALINSTYDPSNGASGSGYRYKQ